MMIPNSSNYEESDPPMLLDFIKQCECDDVMSKDEYAFGIPSSVVEETSCTA